MKSLRSLCLAAAFLLLAAGVTLAVTPVGTTFTYQGALQDAGNPASGPYDFQFKLFDAGTGGTQVGSTITVDDLAVAAGVFTVQLDFGAAFGPDARWLEIGVRPGASADPYTLLNPRQSITASPVSLYSLDAADGNWNTVGTAITNANAPNFVGVNRSTRVTGSEYFGIQAPTGGYGGMYIRTDGASGQPFYGYSNGLQSAWTYFDGGTGNWIVYNGGDRLTVLNSGNVGVGTNSPSTKLQVNATDSDAIYGTSNAAFSNGVKGYGLSAGVRGECGTSDGAGVEGVNNSATGTGVKGSTSGTGGAAGVAGYANFGTGVYGSTSTGYGIYGSNGGSNSSGYAGYFNGRVHVAGLLSKASGSFRIDHPLDPLNKTLSHSFVESPDMMNIYNGNATTDGDGRAVIDLPEYFEALNKDFRYQLTVLGGFAQATVESEVKDHRFVIRTDKPGMKVSWQVTGIRHDAWAVTHPIVVEEEKSMADRGHYINPGAYATSENVLPSAAGPIPPTGSAAPAPVPAATQVPAAPKVSR